MSTLVGGMQVPSLHTWNRTLNFAAFGSPVTVTGSINVAFPLKNSISFWKPLSISLTRVASRIGFPISMPSPEKVVGNGPSWSTTEYRCQPSAIVASIVRFDELLTVSGLSVLNACHFTSPAANPSTERDSSTIAIKTFRIKSPIVKRFV